MHHHYNHPEHAIDKDAGLCDRILHISRMLRRQAHKDQQHGRGDQHIVRVLCHHDGLKASELSHALDIRPSSLTDALDRLEASSLIRRARDEQDLRSIRIYLTDEAKAQFAVQAKARAAWEQKIDCCLNDTERETFYALCDKIATFLRVEQDQERSDA